MSPKTTVQFLDALATKEGGCSDYRLSKILGVTPQGVATYRKGKTFSDDTAMKVAQLLDLDAAYVVMCMHQERAKTEAERELWASMLQRLGGLAASFALAFVMVSPEPAHAVAMRGSHTQAGYAQSLLFSELRKRVRRLASQLFPILC